MFVFLQQSFNYECGGFFFHQNYLQLKGFELIKGVHLDTVPFDMERDLITPSYKKKRPQLLKYYQVNFSFFTFHINNTFRLHNETIQISLSLMMMFSALMVNCLNLCSCLRRKRLMKCITRQTSEAFILLWSQCEEGICWASLRLYTYIFLFGICLVLCYKLMLVS